MAAVFFSPKPWLGLFRTDFVSLRDPSSLTCSTPAPSEESESKPNSEPPSTPHLSVLALPSEVLNTIFSRLEPEHLSAAAQVCNKWLSHAYEPHHWRRIAQRTWPHETVATLERKLYQYKTWRILVTQRPRLRTTAIYVSRHQFAKTACRAATAEPQAPVFLVTYYRMLRFYNDGTVVALTTPELPHLAYKRVRRWYSPSPFDRDKPTPSVGKYTLDEATLDLRLTLPMSQPRYPAMRTGTIFMRFSLASTALGAFNRLFLTEHYAIMDNDGGDLVSYGSHELHGKPFRLVPLFGFRDKVYHEFPRDDHKDLEQWYEMKRASRNAKRQRGSGTAEAGYAKE